MYQVKFFDQNGKHLENYDQAYIMNEAGAEQCIENFREYYPVLKDATAEISEFTYEWMSYGDDPFDSACDDCEVRTVPVYEPVTDAELHQAYEEDTKDDDHAPSYGEYIRTLLNEGYIRVA